jgi:hypothetical protein
MKRFRSIPLTALFIGSLLMQGCPVRPLTITPGFAFFEVLSPPPTKDVIGPPQVTIEATILQVDSSKLPVDFFDSGSDPLNLSTAMMGYPLMTTPLVDGDIGTTDTIMAILDEAVLDGIGSTATAPVKIPQMNLVATQLIEVTYDGGQNPELWELGLDLNIEDQQPGVMGLMRTSRAGGTAEAQIPILAKLSFVRMSDSAERTLELSIDLIFELFNWTIEPDEVNWPAPGRTNLVPALSRVPTVGRLFRREQAKGESAELLIFITPTIIEE